MIPIPADISARPEVLVSVSKPLIVLAVFSVWGMAVGHLDKDAAFFHFRRHLWSAIHMSAGILALFLVCVVPFFAVGLPLALLVLAMDLAAYVLVRNRDPKVSADQRWTWDYRSFIRKYEHAKQDRINQKAPVKLLGKGEQVMDIPSGSDSQAQAFSVFAETMEFAAARHAQKVEFTVSMEKESAELRVWLDGVEYPQQAPEPKLALEVIDFLKAQAGMDVSERRRKQAGKIFVQVEGHGRQQLVVTSIGTTRSISLTFELNADKRTDLPFESMGYTADQRDAVHRLINAPARVVLLSIPPMNGGTALLHSMVKSHDAYTSTIMIYERNTEVEVDGAKHVKYPENGTNDQINAVLGSLLRSEPTVMVLPNGVLDAAMARSILNDAATVRFYLPIAAKDTVSALQAWKAACGDAKLSADAVAGAISGKLLRRLCQTCRVPYQPDAEAMRKINFALPQDGVLYKASGKVSPRGEEETCRDCQGVGYKGRISAYEVLVLDDTARQYLAGGQDDELRVHLRKSKMKTLEEAALAHVASGITDVREVRRVLNQPAG